jgi:hypothetical protein
VEFSDAMSNTAFGNAGNIDTLQHVQGIIGMARVVERSHGSKFGLGARAFLGAEFFVLPKLSVGGEFGWSIGYLVSGRSETVLESIGQSSSAASVRQTTIDGSGSDFFYLDNDNGNLFGGPSASLKLSLYF